MSLTSYKTSKGSWWVVPYEWSLSPGLESSWFHSYWNVRMEVFKVMGRSGVIKEHEKCGQALCTAPWRPCEEEKSKMRLPRGNQWDGAEGDQGRCGVWWCFRSRGVSWPRAAGKSPGGGGAGKDTQWDGDVSGDVHKSHLMACRGW